MECNKICRLCASPLNRGGVDLFTDGNVDYLKKIRIYFGLELLNDSDIPVKMCGNCSFEFENIDSFKERCIQAQKSLETLLNKCHYRILSDDELFKNPKDSESNSANIPRAGNQYMILSNQSAGTVVGPNYVNSNGSLQRTGIYESMPINGIGVPQTQFVLLNNQSGVQFQNQNSTSNSHLQNYIVDGNNEHQTSLNKLSHSNDQLTSSVDSNSQENVTKMTNDTLITPKMEVNIKKESDSEEEDDDNDSDGVDVTRPSTSASVKDYDDDSCTSGGRDNESCTVKNDHESVHITVDLVKKVKKEKLDVCEEMSSVSDKKSAASIELLESTDELIVGMQMDDLLLKAMKNNEKDEQKIVSNDECTVIKDNNKAIKNKEIDIFNLNNIKHINKRFYSSSVIDKMIDTKVRVSDIVSACLNKNQEINKYKNPAIVENVEHNKNSTSFGPSKNLDNLFVTKLEERRFHSPSPFNISTTLHNSVVAGNSKPVTAANQFVRSSEYTIQRKEVIAKPGLYVPTKVPTVVPNTPCNSVPPVRMYYKENEPKLKQALLPSLHKINKPTNTMDVYLRSRSKTNAQLKRKVDESDNKHIDPDYEPCRTRKPGKFECPICDRRYNGYSNLMEHMRLHNTQKLKLFKIEDVSALSSVLLLRKALVVGDAKLNRIRKLDILYCDPTGCKYVVTIA